MAKYTENQLKGMEIARQNERVLAKASRHARWNNDLKGYLAAQNAGYMYRGIENVDDKNLRYFQKANERRFYGDAGAGVGSGDTQRPAEGQQQPAGGAQTQGGGSQPPTGGQPSIPAKPKSFFEERASGRQDFVDTIRNQQIGEEGVTDKFAEQAREQGAALGLTPEQIQATLDGETELSPEAIARRAKSRKEEAYQKEFGESDAKWAERIKDLPADRKVMLEGLTPQQKKDLLEKESISNAEIDKKTKEILDLVPGAIQEYKDIAKLREEIQDSRARLAPTLLGFPNFDGMTGSIDQNLKDSVKGFFPQDLSNNKSITPYALSESEAAELQKENRRIENSKGLPDPSTVNRLITSRNLGISAPPLTVNQKADIKKAEADRKEAIRQDEVNAKRQRKRDSIKMDGFGGSLVESLVKGLGSGKWSDDTKEEKIARQKRIKQAQEAGLTPTPPQVSIDTNNASKEFRSGYDSLKALESFTI